MNYKVNGKKISITLEEGEAAILLKEEKNNKMGIGIIFVPSYPEEEFMNDPNPQNIACALADFLKTDMGYKFLAAIVTKWLEDYRETLRKNDDDRKGKLN